VGVFGVGAGWPVLDLIGDVLERWVSVSFREERKTAKK
jgi:hypothetical protein